MKKDNPISIFSANHILFPAEVEISFAPIFDSLRNLAGDKDPAVATFASNLLEELKDYPVLETGFSDEAVLEELKQPIAKLLRVLFPDILQTNEIKGVTAPFGFQPFFTSTRFKNILNAAGEDFDVSLMNFNDDELYIFVCCVILGKCYGYPVDIATPFRIPIPDLSNKINRVYRVAFNADMISIVPNKGTPTITKEDHDLLIDRFNDIALWKEKFPPGGYKMTGFGIMNLMDITVDQSIAGISTNLLTKSNSSLDDISIHLRTIFRKPNLRVGYVSYDNDCFSSHGEKYSSGIFLNQFSGNAIASSICAESYEHLIGNRKPLVVTNTEIYQANFNSPLSELLIKEGIGSYIIIPLVFEEDFLGFMELASENKYELTLASLSKLSDVLPLLTVALGHFKTEAKNEMDAVIQQEYTKIHPSVRWRFEEEAARYILARRNGAEESMQDLDFENVYPLYGQLDIKGSSTIRNIVIQKDINTQLNSVKKILARAYHKNPLPLFEALTFRIDEHLVQINDGLQAGSEHELLHFLRKEVAPVLDHLKTSDKSLAILIRKYEDQLDPQSQVIYSERRKFDESVGAINKVLTDHLDMRQDEAQQMFPHYFERYKTDGIEYNIYTGSSIARGLIFDKMYVQNLRLWQLIVMSELENEFFELKKTLEEPLEIASLIMVHSDPLTIHFRLDEKRFDVKGAYNARYEIIKSRIDKAMIKGTQERVRVPGKLAIVYSNDQDADEYVRYLYFLAAKGYYAKEHVEKLAIEDLQGVTGLKALRISFNYSEKTGGKHRLSVKQLIEAMEIN